MRKVTKTLTLAVLILCCMFNAEALKRPIGSSDAIHFPLDVTAGTLRGFSAVDKFGINHAIPTGVGDNDIWEGGGVYVYDATNTAPIAYMSSSSTSDTQVVSVTGLDIEGYEVSQIITMEGQTVVPLTTPLWRVYRMGNEGYEGEDVVGMIYCHTNATATLGVPPDASIRAIIDNGHNQTLMALYTVPKGFVGFLFRGEVGVQSEGGTAALAEYAHVHYESRRYGRVFRVKKSVTCMVGGGSAVYQDVRSFPDIIPSLTDIHIRCKEATDAMGLFATFDILLVEEDQFSETYLKAIGQPGY